MLDPVTKQWRPNITCRRCRYRHPVEWSCGVAAAHAADQRSATLTLDVPPTRAEMSNDALQQAIEYAVARTMSLPVGHPLQQVFVAHSQTLLGVQRARAEGRING